MVATSDLVEVCRQTVAKSCYSRALAQVTIEEEQGELVLRGQVRSFFMKQMAQVILRPICGNYIKNLLEVSPISMEEEFSRFLTPPG